MGVEIGRTLEGLTVVQFGFKVLLEAIEGRTRFGFGVGIGGLVIPRVSQPTGDLAASFWDFTARLSVDLVRFGRSHADADEAPTSRSALLVAFEFRGNTTGVWGPTLLVGVRY